MADSLVLNTLLYNFILTPTQEDFEKQAQSVTAKSRLKAEVRFKAEVVSSAEWERCS